MDPRQGRLSFDSWWEQQSLHDPQRVQHVSMRAFARAWAQHAWCEALDRAGARGGAPTVAPAAPAKEVNMNMLVVARFTFEGFHCWPTAPDEVAFLRDRHRHVFHVRAWAPVKHEDRDIEFILLGRELRQWCLSQRNREIAGDAEVTSWSCETWCRKLIEAFPYLRQVEVLEDGENGAVVNA